MQKKKKEKMFSIFNSSPRNPMRSQIKRELKLVYICFGTKLIIKKL